MQPPPPDDDDVASLPPPPDESFRPLHHRPLSSVAAHLAVASFIRAFSTVPQLAASVASKRRPEVLQKHLEFVASALDRKISLGCNKALWRAYVTGYLSLMVSCTPVWMLEVDVEVLM